MECGVVYALNARRGMFVVASDGDFFVFEILGEYDVELGARICGELTELGGVTLQYGTEGERIDVYGQSGWASKAAALRMIA